MGIKRVVMGMVLSLGLVGLASPWGNAQDVDAGEVIFITSDGSDENNFTAEIGGSVMQKQRGRLRSPSPPNSPTLDRHHTSNHIPLN